jgi:hypothetical protein
MDDVIIGTVRTEGWDRERFLRDFTASECYWKPLTLEHGTEGTFLETRFRTLPNGITYRLKNDSESRKTVWRYHHYYSGLPYRMKRATRMAMHAPQEVHLMASDSEQLMVSAVAKLGASRSEISGRDTPIYVRHHGAQLPRHHMATD